MILKSYVNVKSCVKNGNDNNSLKQYMKEDEKTEAHVQNVLAENCVIFNKR